jgi:hypothetical protein
MTGRVLYHTDANGPDDQAYFFMCSKAMAFRVYWLAHLREQFEDGSA